MAALRRSAARWSVAVAAGLLWSVVCAAARDADDAEYVGGQVCAGCHAEAARRWRGSHHARAMQEADEGTVLGDFADASLEHFGIVATFFRSGRSFMVRTDGPDAALHDYEIAYTAGALSQLRSANHLEPGNVRYAYVYAIALNSTGAPGQAIQLLERAHRLFPADKDVLVALVSIVRATGDRGTALEHARELAELDPGDIQVRRLVEELERLRPR